MSTEVDQQHFNKIVNDWEQRAGSQPFPLERQSIAQTMTGGLSLNVQPGERILIWGDQEALPLVSVVRSDVLRRGAEPVLYVRDIRKLYQDAQEIDINQLQSLFEQERRLANSVDGMVLLRANHDPTTLPALPEEKAAEMLKLISTALDARFCKSNPV